MITEEIKTLLRAIADEKQMQCTDKSSIKWENTSHEFAAAIISNTIYGNSYFHLRVKPEPIEVWVNEYRHGDISAFCSKEQAELCAEQCRKANINIRRSAILFREVI